MAGNARQTDKREAQAPPDATAAPDTPPPDGVRPPHPAPADPVQDGLQSALDGTPGDAPPDATVAEAGAGAAPGETALPAAADAAPAEASPAKALAADVRAALDRVLAAPDFGASPRLAAFLRFVVEATLDGRADEIKGYTIAVEALGRPASFDPQSDPIVRVEATRLRRALERYYATSGTADPLLIDIPKGGYVPRFLPRSGTAPAPEPGEAAVAAAEPPAPTEPPAPPPVRRGAPTSFALGALAAALVAAAVMLVPRFGATPDEETRAMADRVRLPVVEVRPFLTSGTGAPSGAELRAIEEQVRDAFARFDFVEVKATRQDAPEAGMAEACTGPAARSVFALSGLAEGRADGTFSLIARVTDRCDGSIIWSGTLDGLAQGPALAESERRIVHDISAAVIETYGVIPVRARAQALAKAPASGFGCIAAALSRLRGETTDPRPVDVAACLKELTQRDANFALGYAVRAATQLNTSIHDDTPNPTEAEIEEFLALAERAADLAPASAYAARTLALVQLFAGEPDDAVATAEKALKLNPLDFDVAAAAASVLIGTGRVADGEKLLLDARREGALRTPLQDAFLAFAAFARADPFAAQALVPQLTLHSTVENKLALALSLHTLGRAGEEREAVLALVRRMPDGAEGVRRMVRRLLPAPALTEKALAALESAGLSREAVAGKAPRG